MTATSTTSAFLSPAELVEWLRERGLVTSVQTVRRWLAGGALPGRRLGDRWVIPLASLERWEQGLPTVWDAAMTSALRAVEAGEVQQSVAPGNVPSPFVGRKVA